MRRILLALAIIYMLCGCTHRFEVGSGHYATDATDHTHAADQKLNVEHPAEVVSVRFYVFGAILAVVGVAVCIWLPFKTLGAFLVTCGVGAIVINEFVIWITPYLPWMFGSVLLVGLIWAIYRLHQLWGTHTEVVAAGVNTSELSTEAKNLVVKAQTWLRKRA